MAAKKENKMIGYLVISIIPIIGIMIKARGRNFKVPREKIFPLVGMGILIAFSSLALFQSYNYMEVGIASTLLFVYPIMVALIMATIFKRIFCNHDWQEVKVIEKYEYGVDIRKGSPYCHIFVYKCKNCGAFKKIKT